MRGERRTLGSWPWISIALMIMVVTIALLRWPLLLASMPGYGIIISLCAALIIALGFTILVVTVRDIWLEIQYNEK